MEALEAFNFGWWSIVPPVIAIILALITKEVISSLLFGILAGAFIISHGNLIETVETAFQVMGNRMGENVNILIFLGLLGALVVTVTKAGGSAAYGTWAANKIKSRKGASLATSALGCLIFIDDYFNCLSVGTVMRPVTDKHRISRAKLAYLLDATAAPICIIAPVSSWGASVATYIQEAGVGNGMSTFIKLIPYNLYAILTILMVIIICMSHINFGPMAKFEKNAIEKGDLFSNTEKAEEKNTDHIEKKGKVYDLIIPIMALIFCTILSMIYTGGGFSKEGIGILDSFGNCDSALSLVLGSFFALIITFVLYISRKILSFKTFMSCITEGIQSMVPAFTILILAWTIGGICSIDYLNTGGFIGNLVNKYNTSFPIFILPAAVFLIAAFLGFSTGTSWGTMAILIPIAAAICTPDSTNHLIMPVLGSVLAGAVYGDHISPISDTTILSSTGAGCNHLDHVSTQICYASLVAGCCVVSYLLMGIMNSIIIPIIVGILLVVCFTIFMGKLSEKKLPINYSKIKEGKET